LNSVAATIGVTVLTAMLLGFSLQKLVHSVLPYLGLERQQTVQRGIARFLAQMPGNVATLRDVLDAAPNADRPVIIAAAQRPQLHIHLLDAPLPKLAKLGDPDEPDAILLRNRILALMRFPRPVIVADRYLPGFGQFGLTHDRIEKGVMVETPLADGHWLLFMSRFDPPPPFDPVAVKFNQASFATWLSLSIVLGILLSILAARRLVKPLSELAVAVGRLGGSGEAPPIAPRGPREVQGTIMAFNQMQERLRRFNDDRTRMIAAMSHDLRTPLTRLRLRTELIESPVHQEKMQAEIDFMSQLIDSILSFARDDTTREPRTMVDLSALVEAICEGAADAGDPVTFSGPREVTISCRPAALRRAVSNLVENAVKYGKTASVTIACTAGRAIITVEDEGPGIPRAERERVFDPFYRMETSRNLDTGGVGLGLSVTRSIILEHGGEIILADRKGGGLLVRVELPGSSELKTSDRASEGSNGVPREQVVGVDNT
jgi:signal transduction histidine kinase